MAVTVGYQRARAIAACAEGFRVHERDVRQHLASFEGVRRRQELLGEPGGIRVYDDFAAVARDLIATGVTSPRRLGIQGGSNGGLLMGVEFTQHPELWRAVDIQVPLLDMLRYEKIAAGASWVGEYGSVSNPEQRAFLASISPYNNIKAGVKYPEPFIWTTTKDDRVGPQHARKFAAKLSAMGIPYLYYEVIAQAHGPVSERTKRVALRATTA